MSRLRISSLILSPPEEIKDFVEGGEEEAKTKNHKDQDNEEGLLSHIPTPTLPSINAVLTSEPVPKQDAAGSLKADSDPQLLLSPPDSPATPPPSSRRSRQQIQQRHLIKSASRLARLVDPTVVPQDEEDDEDEDKVALRSRLPEPTALFPPLGEGVDAAIQDHISKNAVHFVPSKSKGDKRTLRYQMPSLEEYRLAVSFVTCLQKQQAQTYADTLFPTKRMPSRPLLPDLSRKTNERITLRLPPPPGARKTPKDIPSPRQATIGGRVRKSAPTTLRIRSVPRTTDDLASGKSRGIGGTPHTRHREPKKPIDDNWRALPDYAPSTALLDNSHGRALKIDWDGNPLDISDDADIGELHEAERSLASSLRLSCARYLTCKRRIFVARVEALRVGKEFKKTDAQQACQIDVNKASKLWLAYEKVGWLAPALFKEYL